MWKARNAALHAKASITTEDMCRKVQRYYANPRGYVDPEDLSLFCRLRDKLLRQTPLTIEYWLCTLDIAIKQWQRRAPIIPTIDIATYFGTTSGDKADDEATESSGGFCSDGGDSDESESGSSESSVISFDFLLPSC